MVIVDGYALKIDLSQYSIPGKLHALQWRDGQGEEEYTGEIPNKTIDTLASYDAILFEHQRQKAVQDLPEPPPTHQELLDLYRNKLDQFADAVRGRFLPGGTTVEREYVRVAQQTREFIDNGMQGEPPSGVADHMRRYSVDATTAVEKIRQVELKFNGILDTVRSLRMDGKTALEALPETANEAEFEVEFNAWANQMDQFKDQS
ncbi:hypothetical protein GZ78_03970 [Endozoicomonas numazuensis]|uniref:Uncharacterized protein n=2 Tax=Endozoicomonas numazuensis TaxID=1137799 RepID=A0A081NL40_9GAMM|nr:hypothetical protein GZ78_03970 [Endozoicomonas numazuensis]